MTPRFFLRFAREVAPLPLAKFAWNFGFKGVLAVNRFKRDLARGVTIPAFPFISVTNRCNLKCRGCWVSQSSPPLDMPPELLDKTIVSFNSVGSYFFGLLGGEPLLYPHLVEIIARHPKSYFQVFTNGIFLSDEIAREMRRLGNVTALVSVEGLEDESARRRGNKDVFAKTMQGIENCRRNRIPIGCASSVCKSNFNELLSEDYIDAAIRRGVHYLWYYIYRPSGENPCPEEALDREQILLMRKFIVEQRLKKAVAIVDAYWDDEGRAICPAATGISHHVNPRGEIEPCPVIQFACDKLETDSDVLGVFEKSDYLRHFRGFAANCGRGCVYLENPRRLQEFSVSEKASPSSGRIGQMEELPSMPAMPGHDLGADSIPEKSILYRFAKKNWFFGFGAYG